MQAKEVWKYVLGQDYVAKFDNKYGLEFSNKHVTILGNTVIVKTGYAWNGLESKYFSDSKMISLVFKLLSGMNSKLAENGLPALWEATLLFDVFRQHDGQFKDVALKVGLDLFSSALARAGVSGWVISIAVMAVKNFIAKK